MKTTNIFSYFIVSIWSVFFLIPSIVFAGDETKIDTFSSHIIINTDGSADVQEEIVYNFADTKQHGIYREIPLVFSSGGTSEEVHTEISSISVTDGNGSSRQTSYDKGGNMVTLKIGDPDSLVTGRQLYVVRYKIWGAMTPTILQDVFVWDATGHDWKVPMGRVRVDVVLPEPLSKDVFSYSCFIGENKSNIPCENSGVLEYATSGLAQTIRFEGENLSKRNGISLELKLRKGIVIYTQSSVKKNHEPFSPISGIVKWWSLPFIDLSLSFPFFVFAGLYSIYLSQKKALARPRRTKRSSSKSKHPQMVSMKKAYILSGVIISGLSLFVSNWNLGIFATGVVIFCFAWIYPSDTTSLE